MTAAAGGAVTCTWSNITGKFTIGHSSLTLKWATGANTATNAAALLGFAVSDTSAASTQTSASAQTYGAPVTPSYDTAGANVVRFNELLIGGFARTDLRRGSKVSFTVATPKTDVPDLTAETGVAESVILSREATFSCTLILQPHEVQEFDALLNNSGVSIMFNHGPKSAGNWVPGKCVNVYMPNAKITKNTVSDQDGIQVVEVEAKAYVTSTEKDIHINFV